jgi:hypothetical protein
MQSVIRIGSTVISQKMMFYYLQKDQIKHQKQKPNFCFTCILQKELLNYLKRNPEFPVSDMNMLLFSY